MPSADRPRPEENPPRPESAPPTQAAGPWDDPRPVAPAGASTAGESLEQAVPTELPARNFVAPEGGWDRLPALIAQIKEYADKLQADGPNRGDVKILSRTIRELRYAFKVFAPYRSERKVTVFGSARLRPEHPAYVQAVELGRRMAAEGWYVVTGAAAGIMEAGHRGAGRDRSIGINIMLPFEQSANPFIAGDAKLVNMKYFFTRKLMFVKECDGVVLCPGGLGTLDEGLEVLTLLQTGKRDLVPVVFLEPEPAGLWEDFDRFVRKRLLGEGLISPEDLELYRRTCSVDETVAEITGFYKIYHSQRYVREKLVFRLKERLSDEMLDGINVRFADILSTGRFEQVGALPAEDEQPELAHLPRLTFTFNRRDLGRLRRLTNALNRGSVSADDARGAIAYA